MMVLKVYKLKIVLTGPKHKKGAASVALFLIINSRY
jgi:hypothetical protein